MSDAFARAAAALASDPHLGADALYTLPGTGSAAPLRLRAVLRREDAGLGPGPGMVGTGWSAMLPVAALPARPAKGATLVVGTERFTVEVAELDEAAAAWTVTLRRVA